MKIVAVVLGASLLLGVAAPARGAAKESFTFVVLGDSRGGADGRLSPALLKVLRAVADTPARFVWNTGDMIYGHTNELAARAQWDLYREAIARLHVPVYHVPGNHDLWDEPSARLYRELWGPAYFSVDYGRARFIALDTESRENRLGTEQFAWLKRQLAKAGQRQVFVLLHRPLFPVDGGTGSSLDAYPAERDELHQLFVQYRGILKAVFQGHEHLYDFQEREGVPYYIIGGGGANLYAAPELGGFHHFLLVCVSGEDVKIELRKVGPSPVSRQAVLKVKPGTPLESWQQGLCWQTWDNSVLTEITSRRATEGTRGLQMSFDLALYPWPALMLPLGSNSDRRNLQALTLDLYLPASLKGHFFVTPAVDNGTKHEAPPVRLRPGWNRVRTDLSGSWLGCENLDTLRGLEWALSSDDSSGQGSVVFDNLRADYRTPAGGARSQLLEGWERPLWWRLFDESVRAEPGTGPATNGQRGLKLVFNLAECAKPVLLARLNPAWDLRAPEALVMDVYAPDDLRGEVSVGLALRAREVSHRAPPVALRAGWNRVQVDLGGTWLPKSARAAAEQIEWWLSSTNQALQGWVVFSDLRAAGRR